MLPNTALQLTRASLRSGLAAECLVVSQPPPVRGFGHLRGVGLVLGAMPRSLWCACASSLRFLALGPLLVSLRQLW